MEEKYWLISYIVYKDGVKYPYTPKIWNHVGNEHPADFIIRCAKYNDGTANREVFRFVSAIEISKEQCEKLKNIVN